MRLCACIMLAVLLSPASGLADGLMTLTSYSTAHDYNCGVVYAGEIRTLELGMIEPVNPSFAGGAPRAVANIGGFECRLVPQPGVVILGITPAVPGVLMEIGGGIWVGFDEPVPVVDPGKTVLAYVEILLVDQTGFPLPEEMTRPCYLSYNTWIGIEPGAQTSIPGEVSFVDADDPIDPIVAARRNEGPDYKFTLLQAPVGTIGEGTWGGLKSIYR